MLRLSLRRHQLHHSLHQQTKKHLARWEGAEVMGLAQSTLTCRMPSSILHSRSASKITACRDRSNTCSSLVTTAAQHRRYHHHHHNYRENNGQGNSGNSSNSNNNNYNRHNHRHHQNYNNNNGYGNSESSSDVRGSNQQQQYTRRQRGDGHSGGGNNYNYQQQQQQQQRYDQRGGGDSSGHNVSSPQQYSNNHYHRHHQDQSQQQQRQQQQVNRSPQANNSEAAPFSRSSSSGDVHASATTAKSSTSATTPTVGGSSGSHHATRARGGPSAAMQGTTSAPFLSKNIKDRAPIGGALEIQQSRRTRDDDNNKNDSAGHKGITVRGRIPAEHHCVAVLVDTESVAAEEFIANILPTLESQCGPLTAEFAGNTRRSLRLAFPTPPANIPLEITSPLISYLSMDEEAEAMRTSPASASSSSSSLLSPSGTYYYNSLLRQAGGSAYFPSIFGNTADDDLSSLRSSAAFLHGTSSSANENEKGTFTCTANGLTPVEDAARRPIPATVPAKHIAGVYDSYHSARPVAPAIADRDHSSQHSPSLGSSCASLIACALPPNATVCLVRCYGHGIISPQWRKVLTLLGNSVRERDQRTTKVRSTTTADVKNNNEKRVQSADHGEDQLRFSLQISTEDLPAPPIYSKNRRPGLATHASDADEDMEKAESTPDAATPKPSSLAALSAQLFGKDMQRDQKQGSSSGGEVVNTTRQSHPTRSKGTIHLSNKAAIEYFQVDEFLPTAVQMTAEIGHLLHHSPTNMLTGIVTCVGPQDRAGFLFEAMRHQRHFVSQYVLTGNKGKLEGTSFGPVFIESDE